MMENASLLPEWHQRLNNREQVKSVWNAITKTQRISRGRWYFCICIQDTHLERNALKGSCFALKERRPTDPLGVLQKTSGEGATRREIKLLLSQQQKVALESVCGRVLLLFQVLFCWCVCIAVVLRNTCTEWDACVLGAGQSPPLTSAAQYGWTWTEGQGDKQQLH